jgi:hypothetical protein
MELPLDKIPAHRRELKTEIAKDLGRGIELLSQILSEKFTQMNDVFLLSGRFNRNKSQLLAGTIEKTQFDLENNKINQSVLVIVEHLTEEDIVRVQR